MRQVIGHSPSAKTIERLTRRVGAEKNSSFERMKAPAESSKDPCATLPDTFRRVAHFGMQLKREDGRLQDYLRHRPGYVFTRRPPPNVATYADVGPRGLGGLADSLQTADRVLSSVADFAHFPSGSHLF